MNAPLPWYALDGLDQEVPKQELVAGRLPLHSCQETMEPIKFLELVQALESKFVTPVVILRRGRG